MIERLVIALILFVVGVGAYRLFSRRHVQRAAANAASDPILQGLKTGIPAIVYFTTPTCIPCRTQQRPALARLQAELGDSVQVVTIDATEDPETASRWGVFSAPTTFVLDGSGQPRAVNHGVADTNTLKRQIGTVGTTHGAAA
jgi:thiol-disulfide isomerase/thioredoxin